MTDPSLYNSVDRTLTRAQRACLHAQKSDPYRRHRRATSTTTGAAYVPFNILSEQGVETPARYVKVHLDVPNPFAEARMSMHGPVYRGEIHAAPINDTETPALELDCRAESASLGTTIVTKQWSMKQWIGLGTGR
jgi:hypothetical protein